MLQPDLERDEHAGPALAVAVRRLLRGIGVVPALLGDGDQRAAVVELLEVHRHGRLVVAVGGAPAQRDPLIGDDLDHLHGERAGEVGEVPRDRRTRLQTALGAAGGEELGELVGVDDRLEHVVDGLGDATGDLEVQ